MRPLALVAGLAALMLVAATQVPGHIRLPVSSVVLGAILTQPFGCTTLELEPYDPSCPTHHIHTGIDLAAPMATEVFSATAGVASTGRDPAGAGDFVSVAVDAHVRVFYGHLSAFRVGDGAVVNPGQLIGLVGMTGLATGPHVHLEIDIDHVAVDPALYLSS